MTNAKLKEGGSYHSQHQFQAMSQKRFKILGDMCSQCPSPLPRELGMWVGGVRKEQVEVGVFVGGVIGEWDVKLRTMYCCEWRNERESECEGVE